VSWLLDTDVLSQPAKRQRNSAVVAWLVREESRIYASAVTLGEIAYWVRSKQGGERERLQRWLRTLIASMEGRILSFNVGVAHVWAEQQRSLEEAGVRMPIIDSLIAATARRHKLTIVTGNEKDFRRPGLKIFNPFKELAAE
jgi:toxin FitB